MFAALNSFQTGGGIPVFVSEVFSTTLYTGNGSTQTITNNIDVSTKGGLIWAKARSGSFATADHLLQDSARGFGDSTGLASSTTSAQFSYSGLIQSVSSTGFTTGSNPYSNAASTNYVAWTFREQPKFFDIVTYTGNGTTQNIAHSLGSTPGCIIVKNASSVNNWQTWHRGLTSGYRILLNSTAGETNVAIANVFGNNSTYVAPTSTQFTVGSEGAVNQSGETMVAYLFAHDAGGFVGGNVISCGSYTGNGSAASGPIVTLGYEPQWLLTKRATGGTGNWAIFDSVRGIPTGSADAILYPNVSDAEVSANAVDLLTNGFQIGSSASYINNNGDTYIYIAINAS